MLVGKPQSNVCLVELGRGEGKYGWRIEWCKQPAVVEIDMGGDDSPYPLCREHATWLMNRLRAVLTESEGQPT